MQSALLRLSKARQRAYRLHRPKAAHKPAHRAQNALCGAIVAIIGIVGITNEAAIAWRVCLPSCECANLSVKLPNRGADQWHFGRKAQVIDDQARCEIVAAINYNIDARQYVGAGVFANPLGDRVEGDVGV